MLVEHCWRSSMFVQYCQNFLFCTVQDRHFHTVPVVHLLLICTKFVCGQCAVYHGRTARWVLAVRSVRQTGDLGRCDAANGCIVGPAGRPIYIDMLSPYTTIEHALPQQIMVECRGGFWAWSSCRTTSHIYNLNPMISSIFSNCCVKMFCWCALQGVYRAIFVGVCQQEPWHSRLPTAKETS